MTRPVIAVAGLGIESSTFSPARTEAAAFHPLVGDAVTSRYPFLAEGEPLRAAADWRGALVGKALPGGTVTRAAWDALTGELVERLRTIVASDQLDGLWYDVHGAMTVEGLDDAEAVLLDRIRAVIGDTVPVSTSMDLHGNVSARLVHRSDLITCYRMAPHEDAMDTKERAVRNLLDLVTATTSARGTATRPGGTADPAPPVRPHKAWVPVPVLLPGEQTSTRIEPARSLYAEVPVVEQTEGVIDAAVWVGYAWADEPRNRAAVVVTGWDEDAVRTGAERLAQSFWDAREDFRFVAPTGSFAACLDAAVGSDARPFFVSDSGDNPTAGGAGDVTWGLARLLDHPAFRGGDDGPTAIYASLPAPDAVRAAVAAGVGATISVTAGALVDAVHEGPLALTGVVHAIRHGDRDAETEVVLLVGRVAVVLTALRKPYHHEHDFTDLDLDPRSTDVVVVKIGYLEPELYAMAADWMLALTPGGVDQDLLRLGHRRIRRPVFPFDRAFPVPPDLSARMVPAPSVPLDPDLEDA